MDESILQFMKDYMPLLASAGCGAGFLIGAAASLLGYSINKIQGFFE